MLCRIGGGGLIAPAMVVAAAFFGWGTSASAESIGGAEIVVNEVKGNLAEGRVVAVLRGDDVYRDEGVRTQADSSAKLVLRDNTVLTVGPSSLVKLDRFVYAGEGLSGAIGVNVLKGALRFTTGNAAKHSYLITTPTAAIGVRGTIFRIEATASKTRVVLEEGAIDVCMRNFKQRCVTLDHPGQQATVTTTQVAMTTDPASPSVGAATGNARAAPAAAPAAAAPAAAPAAAAPAAAPAAAAPAAAPAAAAPAAAPAAAAPAAAPAAAAPAAAPAAAAPPPAPRARTWACAWTWTGPGPGAPGNGQGNGNGVGVGKGGNNGHGHNGGGQGNGNGGGQGNGNGGGGGATGHGH